MIRISRNSGATACPRFKWSAAQAWLEGENHPVGQDEKGLIPMAERLLPGKADLRVPAPARLSAVLTSGYPRNHGTSEPVCALHADRPRRIATL
ncbi:MAG: hypothetical protein ACE5GZ_14510 [Gammaproteobacteria bacterium]